MIENLLMDKLRTYFKNVPSMCIHLYNLFVFKKLVYFLILGFTE